MALGMEMLVKTMIGALGLDANVVIAKAEEFSKYLIGQVKNFDSRLSVMEKQNAIIIEQNQVFIDALRAAGLVETLIKDVSGKALTTEVKQD